MNVATISPEQAWKQLQSNPDLPLIDVRTPAEFASVRAQPARSMPLDRLDPTVVAAARKNPADALFIICKSGGRSAQACQKLTAAGVANCFSVEGGTVAWEKAGLPTVHGGRRVISLDRQIQITAGLLALIGLALGTFVNPWGYVLTLVVATGLTFAGLTGLCPMAILMARMPWNKSAGGGTTCATK